MSLSLILLLRIDNVRWENARNPPENLVLRDKKYPLVRVLLTRLRHRRPHLETSDTTFTCLFCHHDKSVTVRLDRKEGVAQLVCRVCDQRYQSKVNRKYISFRFINDIDLAQTLRKPSTFTPNGSMLQMPLRGKNRFLGVQLHPPVDLFQLLPLWRMTVMTKNRETTILYFMSMRL